jgi:pimeloyl-ACP methyl ester carboxylesterase
MAGHHSDTKRLLIYCEHLLVEKRRTMTAARFAPGTASPPAGAPAWFARVMAAAPERRTVQVAGARISYRAWGEPGLPGVVLVHGGAAHSGWWDHIAPQLAGYRVVAPDLSGYGDSEHRDAYDMRMWAREIAEVTATEDLGRPVVVGHSKGGWAAITAGVEHHDRFSAVVAIDSPLHVDPPDEAWLRRRQQPARVYPSKEAAVERFVTVPPQELVLPAVRQHIAENSLRPVEGGWTWKFDRRTFSRLDDQADLLGRLDVPFTFIRCGHGLVSEAMAEEIARLARRRPPLVPLSESGHHPMLDHPQTLVATLQTLLAVWPAS